MDYATRNQTDRFGIEAAWTRLRRAPAVALPSSLPRLSRRGFLAQGGLVALGAAAAAVAPTASPASAAISVPFLSQRAQPWAPDLLGFNTDRKYTIADFGCVITSVAMIFNYYQGGFTNPRAINEALKAKKGFQAGSGLIIWDVTGQVAPAGVTYEKSTTSTATVDDDLRAGRPVLAFMTHPGGTHAIVLVDQSASSYTFLDPWDSSAVLRSWPRGGKANGALGQLTLSAFHRYKKSTVSPPPTSGKPAAPSNVSVSNPTSTSLQVNFKDNATNESRFDIERRTNGGAWSVIGTLNALNGTSPWYFTNTGLSPNTTYGYRLRAFASNGGYSDYSNEASGKTTGSTPAPGPAPTPPQRTEVVTDDRAGGFSKGGPYWWSSSIGYNGGCVWTYCNGSSVSSWGEWRASLAGGNYQVYVFVPRDNATTRNARYEIYHNGGTATRAVNQNNFYDAWVDIGTYNFSSGDARRVRLTDATGEAANSRLKVAFDAIKFVPR